MKTTCPILAILLFSCVGYGQQANVTATIASYAGGSVTATFQQQGGGSPPASQQQVSGPINSSGAFSLLAWNNAYSGYAPSATVFNICASGSNPSTCYSATVNISGSSQDISSAFAGAPTPPGSGGIGSVSGTAPIVAITTGDSVAVSCPSCATGSGLSGMTAGQVPVAATATTVTSSKPLAGTAAGIVTGPTSAINGDIAFFNGTTGQISDGALAGSAVVTLTGTQTLSNKTVNAVTPATFVFLDPTSSVQTQLNSKAPVASPTFTGTATIPIGLLGPGSAMNGDATSTPSTLMQVTATNSGSTSGIPSGYSCAIQHVLDSGTTYDAVANCKGNSISGRLFTYFSAGHALGSESYTQVSSLTSGGQYIAVGAVMGTNIFAPTAATATPGTGVTSITCATATCTSTRGTYTLVGGTATTGSLATIAWTATATAQACLVSQNGNGATGGSAVFVDLGHTVATTTGFTLTSAISVLGLNIVFDYICTP